MSNFRDEINSHLSEGYKRRNLIYSAFHVDDVNSLKPYIDDDIVFKRSAVDKDIVYSKYSDFSTDESDDLKCAKNVHIPLVNDSLSIINTDIPLSYLREIKIPSGIIVSLGDNPKFIGYNKNDVNGAFDYITTRGISTPVKLLISNDTFSVISASVADYITIIVSLFIGLPSIPASLIFTSKEGLNSFHEYRGESWCDEYRLNNDSYEFMKNLYDEYLIDVESIDISSNLITIDDIMKKNETLRIEAEEQLNSDIDQLIEKYKENL